MGIEEIMADLGSLQLVVRKEMGGDSDCVDVLTRGPRFILYDGPGNRSSCHRLRHSQRRRLHNDSNRIHLGKR